MPNETHAEVIPTERRINWSKSIFLSVFHIGALASTFGEGWHNNHHAHPTSARHGLRWYEIDFNWWGIRVLQLFGLARAIKRVRFNAAATVWQLVSGEGKTKGSYEGA